MKINDLRDLADIIDKADANALSLNMSKQNHPPSVWGYCNEGLDLIVRGRYEEAISVCRKAVELDPNFAFGQYFLGWALLKQGRFEEAVSAFEKSIESEKNPIFYRYLGRALINLERFDEAEAAARAAIKLNPDSALSYCSLGKALARQKKYFDADAAFKSAIDLDPENATIHFCRACNLLPLSDELLSTDMVDEAVKHFETAIRLSPDFAEAHFYLGRAQLMQKKRDEAIKHYQIAAGLGYKDAEKKLAELKVAK